MRTYNKRTTHLFCGHWNGSPVEIGEGFLRAVPDSEVRHKHPYHEFYVVLEGEAELEVAGERVPLRAGSVVMVEPGEWHEVVSVSDQGARWVIIKERSEPDSKVVETEEGLEEG
jgi:mannose-6-phosphate isomerase-like protein (cupin superfamily)